MSIGIMGAHRVGKSTLAERLSNETDFGFLQTNVGKVFTDLGIDPAENMGFMTRMVVQNAILSHCEAMWAGEKEPFFTDRTPICMLAYTTADLYSDNYLSEPEFNAYMEYRQRCLRSCHRFFGQLILVQPGIPLQDPGDKPTAAMNPAFIEHINAIISGIAHDSECHTAVYVMPRHLTDLDQRVYAVVNAVHHAYREHDEDLEGVSTH